MWLAWKLRRLKSRSAPHYVLLEALAKSRDPRVVPALAEFMVANPEHRAHAAGILGDFGDARAVPALLRIHEEDTSGAAFGALVKIGDPRAFDAFVRALGSAGSHVRREAAEALGRLRDARAARALEPVAMDDPVREVREAAANALDALGAPWGPLEPAIHAKAQAALRTVRANSGRTCTRHMVRSAGIWSTSSSDDADDAIRDALDALRFLLKHFPGGIPAPDLREVAALGEVYVVWEKYGCENELSSTERTAIDAQDLRQGARQELVRRGLKA